MGRYGRDFGRAVAQRRFAHGCILNPGMATSETFYGQTPVRGDGDARYTCYARPSAPS
eukprot:gene45325-55238_t